MCASAGLLRFDYLSAVRGFSKCGLSALSSRHQFGNEGTYTLALLERESCMNRQTLYQKEHLCLWFLNPGDPGQCHADAP